MSDRDFGYWWNVPGDWVEPPNERRNGWSGMLRVRDGGTLYYVKRQRNHLCRTVAHPLGWPTASREWYYIDQLRRIGLHVAEPVFHGVSTGPEGKDAVLVTRELAGFTALSELTSLDHGQRITLARALGHSLGVMHRARLQHSSLYDKHIMVRWHADRPEIALIDLEKMRRRPSRRAAARHDLEQLRRRQGILGDEEWAVLEDAHERGLQGDSRATGSHDDPA